MLKDDAEPAADRGGLAAQVMAEHRGRPDWSGTSVESSLKSVVLPPPLGPRKPKISPRAIAKLTSLSAWRSP